MVVDNNNRSTHLILWICPLSERSPDGKSSSNLVLVLVVDAARRVWWQHRVKSCGDNTAEIPTDAGWVINGTVAQMQPPQSHTCLRRWEIVSAMWRHPLDRVANPRPPDCARAGPFLSYRRASVAVSFSPPRHSTASRSSAPEAIARKPPPTASWRPRRAAIRQPCRDHCRLH